MHVGVGQRACGWGNVHVGGATCMGGWGNVHVGVGQLACGGGAMCMWGCAGMLLKGCPILLHRKHGVGSGDVGVVQRRIQDFWKGGLITIFTSGGRVLEGACPIL